MERRRLQLANSHEGGGITEPEWPVYLTLYSNNSETGVQLYNYLIEILPEDTVVTLPTTEYDIGDIIINNWGKADFLRISSNSKTIVISNQNLREEPLTPSLRKNGSFI